MYLWSKNQLLLIKWVITQLTSFLFNFRQKLKDPFLEKPSFWLLQMKPVRRFYETQSKIVLKEPKNLITSFFMDKGMGNMSNFILPNAGQKSDSIIEEEHRGRLERQWSTSSRRPRDLLVFLVPRLPYAFPSRLHCSWSFHYKWVGSFGHLEN